jgi:hypothetical protein
MGEAYRYCLVSKSRAEIDSIVVDVFCFAVENTTNRCGVGCLCFGVGSEECGDGGRFMTFAAISHKAGQ